MCINNYTTDGTKTTVYDFCTIVVQSLSSVWNQFTLENAKIVVSDMAADIYFSVYDEKPAFTIPVSSLSFVFESGKIIVSF